jgi:rod shape-determining protein MreB
VSKIAGIFSNDIGIDAGSTRTRICAKGRGIVLEEPSVVAFDNATKKFLAAGADAAQMTAHDAGAGAGITVIRAMKDDANAVFDFTGEMFRHFFRKASVLSPWRIPPRAVVAVPPGIAWRRAMKGIVTDAGGTREIITLPQTMAAALGAGMPIEENGAGVIVDIGAGAAKTAVISLANPVFTTTTRTAGDELDAAIARHMKRAHNLLVGERAAEQIKICIGSAWPLENELAMEVRARDAGTGAPKTITITSREIRAALAEPLADIATDVAAALEHCPREAAAGLARRGITLTGGGALLRGIARFLSDVTGLPAKLCEDPQHAVIAGTGIVLEQLLFSTPGHFKVKL